MKSTGEYGQYFPKDLCPFGYNETIAMEQSPLTKEEAQDRGYQWCDYEVPTPQVERTLPADKLPDSIQEVPDDVLNWAITCEISQKPFKVTKHELGFYRMMNLPLPKRHPDVRHQDRMAKRPPWKLFDRPCSSCQKALQSSYSPEQPEKVYCEQCYLEQVY